MLAHRGDHREAAENTQAAFLAAVTAGADGVELDVRSSRDGEAIVLHDATLDRVQGVATRAADLTAADLAGHGVPLLRDVLATLPPDFLVDVELKEPVVTAALAAIRATRGRSATGIAVSSFDPGVLAAVGAQEPAWERWLIATDADADVLAAAARLGCRGLALEWHAIREGTVAAARRHGLRTIAWTVRDREELDHVISLGVDGVCAEGSVIDRA